MSDDARLNSLDNLLLKLFFASLSIPTILNARAVREGDIVLISPWDFAYEAKGDIIFRYTQNQARSLRDSGLLKMG